MRKPRFERETNTARFMHYGGVCFSAGGLAMGVVATGFLLMAEHGGPLTCMPNQLGTAVCERAADRADLERSQALFVAAGSLAIVGAASALTSRRVDHYLILRHGLAVFDQQLTLVLDENEEELPVTYSELGDPEDEGGDEEI